MEYYLARWKCDESYRYIKQCYHLEDIRVLPSWLLRGEGLLDERGNVLSPGKVGEIAFWRNAGWFRVKDAGYVDHEGYYWHKGRADDIIISAGWTISPVEVEDVLQRHPAVAEASVIGIPDKDRGQIVKVYIKANIKPTSELKKELQEFIKERLSRHEYPRAIEFVDDIPKTSQGKLDKKALKRRAGIG